MSNLSGPRSLSRVNRRAFLGGAAGAVLAGSLLPVSTVFGQESSPASGAATSYTFLALGLDASAEGAANSDVIMVSRLNTEASTLRTLSIPRGLLLDIPGFGQDTLGRAYELGIAADPAASWESGAGATVDAIEENFGLTIDGTVVTDMERLATIVDTLGGVEVNNPAAVSDPSLGDFPAGPLTLTGADAVNFSRVLGEDGTAGRLQRQQALLQGLLDKVTQPEIISELPDLIQTLTGAVQTDVPANVQAELVAAAVSFDANSIEFASLEDQLTVQSGVAPAQVYEGDWATLPEYVQTWLDGSVG